MEELSVVIQNTIKTTIEQVIINSKLLVFDWSTLILSVLAIIISIWSAIWTSKRVEKSNYKSKLYENILQEPLQVKIPELLQKSIDFNKKTVNDISINEFEEYIGEFRRKIIVFKYINKKFYEKLNDTIIKIDEVLVLMIARKENIEYKFEELYKLVENMYILSEKYLFR